MIKMWIINEFMSKINVNLIKIIIFSFLKASPRTNWSYEPNYKYPKLMVASLYFSWYGLAEDKTLFEVITFEKTLLI